MKPSAWVTILFMAAGVVSACSSGSSAHPPIEGSGGTPTPSPGGSSPGGGTPGTSNDGGTVVTGTDASFIPEGGVCNATNCGGCCSTLNQCQEGVTNLACGVSGTPCQTCSTGLTCTNGTCQ